MTPNPPDEPNDDWGRSVDPPPLLYSPPVPAPRRLQPARSAAHPGPAVVLIFVLLAMVFLGVLHLANSSAKKAGTEKKVAKTSPAPPPTARKTVEMLVLKHACLTPCSAHVGWSYKVQTDGDAIRIKYSGCNSWFNQPAKENRAAPSCFRPGDAEFKSSGKNPHVQVRVYKKVTVRQ